MLLNTLFKHWSFRIFAPGTILREKYEAFKRLLRYDTRCHEQMAEFQDLLHGHHREDLARVRMRFTLFSGQVAGMISCLETMAPGEHVSLKDYHKKFDFYVRFLLAPPKIDFGPPFVLSLDEIHPECKNVGNKAKNLALLKNKIGAPVPQGFAVTANAFHYLIEFNNLRGELDDLLSELNIESSHSLNYVSTRLMERIRTAEVPPDIEQAMLASFCELETSGGRQVIVAVRSSAISEDGECSFAGQYTTLLGITRKELISAYREVLASKYSPEALFYRICHGLGDEETAMSVLVLEMVAAKSSGVLYTRAPMQGTGNDNDLHLHVIQGMGEALVSGAAVPDLYVLTREKQPRLLHKKERRSAVTQEQVEIIGGWGVGIEEYFNTPQDIEWAIDSNGELLFLQARPLHVSSVQREYPGETTTQEEDLVVAVDICERASGGVSAGMVYRLDSDHVLEDIPDGAVLVTRDTPPGYVQVINRLAAVIAERGSRASHFATVAREFGVPFLVETCDALNVLEHGSTVTVDGDHGVVYQGRVESLLLRRTVPAEENQYHRTLREVLKFITPLELMDPAAENFTPEGCRSMHDIIRFCHEKAVQSMFSAGRPGTGRGALKMVSELPLDVFLFDVGGGIDAGAMEDGSVPLDGILSEPFHALWQGLAHPDVQWKQKPFDWDAYDKIELAGGIPPSRDSFAFASYAVIGADYLHFNIRFGYHFTIVDVLCGENTAENYCLLRFAGGGGDFAGRSLRIEFITRVLQQLGFTVEKKGDMLEGRLAGIERSIMLDKLDLLGRLLGATKLMDMVLQDEQMVADCVEDFFHGRYSFSQQG